MNTSIPSSSSSEKRISFSFDVGHSSIGWSVIDSTPTILGCGVVTFPKDDCLASIRRIFRRQRRHVRATRQRILRIERLLAHLEVLTKEALIKKHSAGGGHSAPWLLAARVLRGGALLTWEELWDVIRWYAHNRGYDGNAQWSKNEPAPDEENTEKVKNAHALFEKYGTKTVAETFCAISGLDPLGKKTSCNLSGKDRPKGQNAAFPRANVIEEVASILDRHCGKLPKLDASFIASLMTDWQALPCPGIQLPARYKGGLLFGQLIPRLDNRIIETCPITYEGTYQEVIKATGDEAKARHEALKRAKVPQKDCLEFYRYRWAMQVANIQIACGPEREVRSLTVEERAKLDQRMSEKGFLTAGELKKAVKEIVPNSASNVEQILTHPDAEEGLIVDPARKAIYSKPIWKAVFPELPESLQKRAIGQLRKGRSISLTNLLPAADLRPPELNEALESALNSQRVKTKRGQAAVSTDHILAELIRAKLESGRAPYSRVALRNAVDFVFTTARNPTEEGGPLYRSEAIRNAQRDRAIDQQTNNHLVRHRLLILERLHADLLREFAGGKPSRVDQVVIEVNRNLRALSGQTAKEIKTELNSQLANFKSVTARLEKAYAGKDIRITPGLIRKARIADDLGWKCPYTGQSFDEFDLLDKTRVDKDHIVPRSDRPSDSLSSMVITFSAVNKMKKKRTGYRFVEAHEGQPVDGMPNLTIKSLTRYRADIDVLDIKGHDDDRKRKKQRKDLLLLPDYIAKEFTPRDLTQTSQLVRLAAQLLHRPYASETHKPNVASLSGNLTSAVRTQWHLLSCLATANPQVIDSQTNEILPKGEIREITHLHHALDASVLGLAATLFPARDRRALELLNKRRLTAQEQSYLKEQFAGEIAFTLEGQPRLVDLPVTLKEQLRLRLAERRVVQHIPAELSGIRVEQNAWRVLSVENGKATLQRAMRNSEGDRPRKQDRKNVEKLLGLSPEAGLGKLKANKAVLIIHENFGLALDPTPRVLPFYKIPVQLRELRKKNGGKPVTILRNGMVIDVENGIYKGTWKVFSIKDNKGGIALDMGYPDVVRLENKTEGHKINVSLATLLKGKMTIRSCALTATRRP